MKKLKKYTEGDSLKLKRATFKYIESELYSYKDTLKEIDQLRDEILYGRNNDDENIGGGRSSLPGKPTEQIATRLLTHKTLRNREEVANAISFNVSLYEYNSLSIYLNVALFSFNISPL